MNGRTMTTRSPARWMRVVVGLGLACAMLVPAGPAAARPLYFQNLTAIYGFAPGDDLYACGVCHLRWEGTGPRNPYGAAVEQQLYLGKPIQTAIHDVEGIDTDGDGFVNGDELAIYHTLPGYSCANTSQAINPPPYFQSIITPGVPSCLEPQDIRVDPANTGFVTLVGLVSTVDIRVFNNGALLPITVSSYGLLPGSNPAFSISGPPQPIVIPVGGSFAITVTFAPTAAALASGTLEIASDDPDEPTIDVALSAISFVSPLAPADARAACQSDLERQMERYSKTHLREWGACYVAELGGVACDGGRRDQRISKAEATLRAYVGGASDRFCRAKGLTPVRLGLPATCGGSCGAITMLSMTDLADCLVCRQREATETMLANAVGTVPPDLPPNVLASSPLRCNRGLVNETQKAIRKLQKSLGACQLKAVTAPPPVDCPTSLASNISSTIDRVNSEVDRCDDTTGMQGCLFGLVSDPTCLGTTAETVATELVRSVFNAP